MVKPRYQFHGPEGGSYNSIFHIYGLGLYTTTYFENDIVIKH
jgi:hypothetical protein